MSAALESQGLYVVRVPAPRLRSVGQNPLDLEIEALGSLEVINSLAAAFGRVDIVVNAAGVVDAAHGDDPELIGANALLPRIVREAAVIARAARLVQVSSAAVQGRHSPLDESTLVAPFSRYSRSKALGESVLRNCPETVIFRPTSVHGSGRPETWSLVRLARSKLASVAAPGNRPTPQVLIQNVAAAIAFVATTLDQPPRVVLQPSDGLTTGELMRALGRTNPVNIPLKVASPTVVALRLSGIILPLCAPNARRLEMLWFGQQQAESWLASREWKPPAGVSSWHLLGDDIAQRPLRTERASSSPPRIVFAVTESIQVPYLGQTPAAFRSAGWHVTVVSSEGRELGDVSSQVHAHGLPMVRDPSPVKDLHSLLLWIRWLRRRRPDAVLVGTPKASLLGALASWGTRVPVRVYLMRGLRLETATGISQRVLAAMERLTMGLSTEVIAVSQSLADEITRRGLCRSDKISVMGSGSSHGVDLGRFGVNNSIRARQKARQLMAIGTHEYVVGFVGRIRNDKGVRELIQAVERIAQDLDVRLVLIGRIERNDYAERLAAGERSGLITHIDHVDEIEHYYAGFDVLCLPSHREGFSNVVLEAAAAGVPSVVSNATGMREAVVHEVTGLIVPLGDAQAIATALSKLHDDAIRKRLGAQARKRVEREFSEERVNQLFIEHFGHFVPFTRVND